MHVDRNKAKKIGDIITFDKTKSYKVEKELTPGATGLTYLLTDEFLNKKFVCKKYVPIDGNKETYFRNFLDEIKIMYEVYHKNIVRIYSHYLYSESFTGYIIMEYVDGFHISDYLGNIPESIDNIFLQTIEAFVYLENRGILHRDIRPTNIMVTSDGTLKIIDFGFGKAIEMEENYQNSIQSMLAWISKIPSIELVDRVYNHQTEMYFVGKLFQHLISQSHYAREMFTYQDVLDKMTRSDPQYRFLSFEDILTQMEGMRNTNTDSFDYEAKMIFQMLFDSLEKAFIKVDNNCTYKDMDTIIKELDILLKRQSLESYIQDNKNLLTCFVKQKYTYNNTTQISVQTVLNFYKLIKTSPEHIRLAIERNMHTRLNKIPRYDYTWDEELPF